MKKRLDPFALGLSGAVVGALAMLLLGIMGNLGTCTGIVNMMKEWHMFFSLSIGGIIAGMAEAAVVSFLLLWSLAWFYNRFSKAK